MGKNLFYNSSMESCLLVCRMKKPRERKGKIIFINGVNELQLERSSAWLSEANIKKIISSYRSFKDEDNFAKVISIQEILDKNNGNLTIPLYVKSIKNAQQESIESILFDLKKSNQSLNKSMVDLFKKLQEAGIEK